MITEDEGWPRQSVADDGMAVTVHQPQVDSWVVHTSIVFRAAVSFTPEDRLEPLFGALRIRADRDANARIEGSRRAGEFKSRPSAPSPRSRPRGGRQLRGQRGS